MSEEKATSMKPVLKFFWKIFKKITMPIWYPLLLILQHEEALLILFFPAMMGFIVLTSPNSDVSLIFNSNYTDPCVEKYGNASFEPDTTCYNYTEQKNQVVSYMKANGAATEDALEPYLGMTSYEAGELIERLQEDRVIVQIATTNDGYDEVYYLNRLTYDVDGKYAVNPSNITYNKPKGGGGTK